MDNSSRSISKVRQTRRTGNVSPVGWIRFGVAIVVTGVVGLAIALTPTRAPYLVVEAVSETMEYRVARPAIAQIPVVGATIRPMPSECGAIADSAESGLTALIQPMQTALVRYIWGSDRVAIRLRNVDGNSPATILLPGGRSCSLPNRATVVIPVDASMGTNARPLPIAGPAEIGVTYGVPTMPDGTKSSNLMHGGSVEIFGYTAAPWSDRVLYPTQDTAFPLPAGGRLTSGESIHNSEATRRTPPWYGVARHGERGFEISATTESKDLRLHRPGVHGETETFAVSLLTVIFNDPSLALVSVLVVTFMMSLQVVTLWPDSASGKSDSTEQIAELENGSGKERGDDSRL